MMRVNLMPQQILDARRQHRRIQLWLRLLGLYVGLWTLVAAASHEFVAAPTDELVGERQAVAAERESINASSELQSARLDELLSQVQIIRDVAGQPDWSILLEHLARPLGDDVGVQSVTVEAFETAGDVPLPREMATGPFQVSILGVATTQGEAARYVLALESAELFLSLDLLSTSPTRIGQQRAVLFQARGVIALEDQP
ncbi:MAG: hypothetical protein AAGB48_10115 [Planctomycetota bacterium]